MKIRHLAIVIILTTLSYVQVIASEEREPIDQNRDYDPVRQTYYTLAPVTRDEDLPIHSHNKLQNTNNYGIYYYAPIHDSNMKPETGDSVNSTLSIIINKR